MKTLLQQCIIAFIDAKELKFIEKIGEGTYGQVWQTKWEGQGGGEVVAVKRIPTNGIVNNNQ